MILSTGNYNKSKQFEEINIQWALTRKCNFCCDFCGVYDNHQKNLSVNDNIIIAKKLLKIHTNKKRTIVLIGGEPTLYSGYEKIIDTLIQYKNNKDVICLFSNGSEDINKFQNNVNNGVYKHVTPLFTFHSEQIYKYPLIDKLHILIKNNILFKVNMMIQPNNLKIIQHFYKEFEKYHNDRFIFECVPIEQYNQEIQHNNEQLNFCKNVNNKNKVETFMNVFYDIYDTETKKLSTEVYTQSQLKLLPKSYFKFIGYRCYSKYRLTLDSDGLLYDFCDRCFFNKKKNLGNFFDMKIEEIEELITTPRLCRNMYCPICDTTLLYKEKINKEKYFKGDNL